MINQELGKQELPSGLSSYLIKQTIMTGRLSRLLEGETPLKGRIKRNKGNINMTKYWCVNFYAAADEEPENLDRGIEGHFWSMHKRYEGQNPGGVTNCWREAGKVRAGDQLLAYSSSNRFHAYGTAIRPRREAQYQDSIERTTKENEHRYSAHDGVVRFSDAECFYDDLRKDNGANGEWAERIDVQQWEKVNKQGVHISGIKEHITSRTVQNAIFGIDKSFFMKVVKKLGGNHMNPSQETQNAQSLLEMFHQVVLQGPPGTGKTWSAKQIAASLLGIRVHSNQDPEEDDSGDFEKRRFNPRSPDDFLKTGAWTIVQFHPSYNYEDFVRGIRARSNEHGISYPTEDRILVKMADCADKALKNAPKQNAQEEEAPRFVLIIDEINRANLASVLGELIYALEYRGREVTLSYPRENEKGVESGDALAIPPNLYIIGTMNTADRSIGHIDYAVRRRFAFLSRLPNKEVITEAIQDEAARQKARELFEKVEALFIEKGVENGMNKPSRYLSSEFNASDVQIGHTYFLSSKKEKDGILEELAMKFTYQVYPILREYYKDGILKDESEENKPVIDLGKIKIPVGFEMSQEDVKKAIEDFLGQ